MKHRTLLRVTDIGLSGIAVIIPAWNSEKEVILMYKNLPYWKFAIGDRFYAKANLEAKDEEKLELESFEFSTQ